MRYLFVMVILLLGATTSLVAQDDDAVEACPALVEEALTIVDESCSGLDRNVVCYGNGNIEAQSADETLLEDFVNSGDILDVADIYTLTTEAMDVEQDVWGIAVLALQANIPDTLPGQNVTFLLYGNTQLTLDDESDGSGEVSYDAPFQAFRFTSGVGEPSCTQAPRDGLLVQSPEGVTVNFMVNGIEVELGSTVLIQGDETATGLTNIEGNVSVTVDSVTTALEVGQSLTVETVDDVAQIPDVPTSFNANDLRAVPITAMPEEVPLPEPNVFLPAGVCAGGSEFNFPVGQQIMFNIAVDYGDAENLAGATATMTINGAGQPRWSVIEYSEFGRDYRFVGGPFEAGTYAIETQLTIPNTNSSDIRNCTIVIE